MADTRIDELRRRLERDPGSRLFAQLAEELRKTGELAEAIRVARSGLTLHPAYPSARLTLGRALLDSGDATAARAELENALSEAPDNILASRFLAQAREQLGDLAGAAAQYQHTLRMSPGDRQVQAALQAVEARLAAPPSPAGDAGPETTPPRRLPPPLPASAATAELPVMAAHASPSPRPPSVAPAPPARPSAPPPPSPAGPDAEAAQADAAEGELPPTLRIRSSQPLEPAPVAAQAAPEAFPAGVPLAPPPGPEPAPAPTLAPAAVPLEAEATTSEPATSSGTTAPFPSSTLAELYYQQGLVDRAKDVYRQLVDLDPGNERARGRLRELEQPLAAAGERDARRRALERTIEGLETLLAAVRRR